ncbi:MAG: hypothetical protein U5J83_03675 [Bryobacterales bacterium]|nr:hypothetical protein [Bryobacterales bacterium]
MLSILARISALLAVALLLFAGNLRADNARRLRDEDKVVLLRGLMAEYATSKILIPRSKKALAVEEDGRYSQEEWDKANNKNGVAARAGDLVQFTKVKIEDDEIEFELNGGMGGRKWYQGLEVGMGGGGGTVPVARQGMNSPGGSKLVLRFSKDAPPRTVDEVKDLLGDVFDFNQRSATEQYMESLTPEVKEAIEEKKAINGMDRDQVILALGKPVRKVRETKDGIELEDWIYGRPPGKIVFVTFDGNDVVEVREEWAGMGQTAPKIVVPH